MEKKVREQLLALFKQYRILFKYAELHETNPQYREFCEKVDRVVNRLPVIEQDIIRYLCTEAEYLTDGDIVKCMDMSRKIFVKHRDSALHKIAVGFGLITVQNPGSERR